MWWWLRRLFRRAELGALRLLGEHWVPVIFHPNNEAV